MLRLLGLDLESGGASGSMSAEAFRSSTTSWVVMGNESTKRARSDVYADEVELASHDQPDSTWGRGRLTWGRD